MLVIKLGGSLITKKSSYCEIDEDEVRRFGNELAAGIEASAQCPIIVLGGGSFGNGIPRRFGLQDPMTRRRMDISRMTFGMFELMRGVVDIWRGQGLACYPVQCSTVVQQRDGVRTINIDPFAAALRNGMIPVTTGDILLEEEPIVYSSDYMPGLIAQAMDVQQIVMLTDVPGVFDMRDPEKRVCGEIRGSDYDRILSMAGGSAQADVTGGMRTKVEALFASLDKGTGSLIADGRRPGMLHDVLLGASVPGTYFYPGVKNVGESRP